MRTRGSLREPIGRTVESDVFVLAIQPGHLELSGSVDAFCSDLLEWQLRRADVGSGDIVLDLSALRFVDGAGIGVLAQWAAALSAGGARVRFVGASGMVHRLWALLDCAADPLVAVERRA
jgi:anti-anti-sigma factor